MVLPAGRTTLTRLEVAPSMATVIITCEFCKREKETRVKTRRFCSIVCANRFFRIGKPSPHRTHGLQKSPEYSVWNQMKMRCYNPNVRGFPDYGGRGITVCDRWRDSFENFIADMGSRPSSRHTLDRVNNSLGYSPDNCQWRTYKDQQQNRRDNHLITFNGETLCVSEWNRRLGFPVGTISQRMQKLKWDAIKALTTPL